MTEALADFHFIRPGWLLLGPVVFGVWKLWQIRSDPLRGWRSQMDADLLRTLAVAEDKPGRRRDRWWLAGSLLALLAVAGPTWRLEPSPFAEDTSPLVILLKASDSMDRQDLSPSPLERAKLKIVDLAELRKGQPLSLIAYAGSAHLVLPPTRDTEVVAMMAAEIDSGVMPVPGDRLDLAIEKAGRLIHDAGGGGSLLVIADSVDGDANTVAAVAQSAGGIPVQFLDLAPAEESSLANVAQAIDGAVQPWTADDEDVANIADTAARRSLASVRGSSPRWEEAGYWLVVPVVLLVALAFRRESASPAEATS